MKKHRLPSRAAASLAAQGHEVFLSIIPSQTYSAGTRLFSQGSPPEHMYWIDWGLVKLIRIDRRGHELLVALRPTGWILGAASVVIQEPHPVTAVTLIDCQLNRLPAQRFLNLAQTNARFSWVVNQLQSREIDDQVSHIIGLGSLSARQRLEQLLLQWVSSVEPPGNGEGFRLSLPFTRIEMAELLAVTPEHLSRLLRQMEREGMIHRDKGWIIITDVERLAHRADFEG